MKQRFYFPFRWIVFPRRLWRGVCAEKEEEEEEEKGERNEEPTDDESIVFETLSEKNRTFLQVSI